MEEVACQTRDNLPSGLSLGEFGKRMRWGRGNAAAIARINTVTLEELRAFGLTVELAEIWADCYDAVLRLTPDNPSAAGRARLMQHVARLLTEK